MNHTSDILLRVELDENRIPERLHWEAEDGGIINQEAKAMLLSVWDHKTKETLRIDLWTKDMPMDEMKLFFHQTFPTMADTFYKANDFCDYFAEKMDLIKK